MKTLVFDTETTGITRLSFANENNYRKWPRMVQIAWIIADDGHILTSEDHLVAPEGFTIPAKAIQIHGISQNRAEREGIPASEALRAFSRACKQTDTLIAHNLAFDTGIVESEALRNEFSLQLPRKRVCTMHLGTRYLRREKGISRGGHPSLSRLYETLLGFPPSSQHNASCDVRTCYQIYRKLSQLGYQ